jgi:hypothetical protein
MVIVTIIVVFANDPTLTGKKSVIRKQRAS